MLEMIYKHLSVLRKHQQAPLRKEREGYLDYWFRRGADRQKLRDIAHQLLITSEYLDLENRKKNVSLEEIRQAANRWGSRPPYQKKHVGGVVQGARTHFIHEATNWLFFLGRLELPAAKISLFSKQLSQYEHFMREEKGLSESTITSQILHVSDFLKLACSREAEFAELDLLTIDRVLAHKGQIDGYKRYTIKTYACGLRSFLKYAETQGWCSNGLWKGVQSPHVFRGERLSEGPSWELVQKLLESKKTSHPTDIRDYAILLLLAVYGLRRSEVCRLSLEDLDWKENQIHVTRSKSQKAQNFPLVDCLGQAIIRYLKEVRPPSPCRKVFLRIHCPYLPLSEGALTKIVRNAWVSAKLTPPHYGPHALRHSCATRLINEGVSLKEISDYLGHQDLETTRNYTKVDLTNLRQVADLDIGGLL